MLIKYYVVEREADPTPEKKLSVDTMEVRLTSPPVRAPSNASWPYILDFDASPYTVGAVLWQKQEDDNGKYCTTVGYWSKKFFKDQPNYSETENEYYEVL